MQRIILDTNFLLIPGQFGVDIFSEMGRLFGSYQAAVVGGSIAELRRVMRSGSGRDKRAASLALQLIKTKALKILVTPHRPVDDILREKSQEGFLIATQDRALQKRLNRCLILRKKQILQVR
ncbi:MAG TPA: hypothetical protein VJC16_07265 [Candidatus Nanoarchaeia archaeon]|nr:hypothetical protein [Candidatus Nanoarchaeia archaeon]